MLIRAESAKWSCGEMDIIPPSEGGGAGSIPAGTAMLQSGNTPYHHSGTDISFNPTCKTYDHREN
jgi:hypothetical protein